MGQKIPFTEASIKLIDFAISAPHIFNISIKFFVSKIMTKETNMNLNIRHKCFIAIAFILTCAQLVIISDVNASDQDYTSEFAKKTTQIMNCARTLNDRMADEDGDLAAKVRRIIGLRQGGYCYPQDPAAALQLIQAFRNGLVATPVTPDQTEHLHHVFRAHTEELDDLLRIR